MVDLKYPLVCFDLDGTLVDDTVFIWSTLHETFQTDAGLRKKAHDDYFSGRISYPEWFNHDLDLLDRAGANRREIYAVLDELRPMNGAFEITGELKARGHKLAVVSGSLDIVVSHIFGDDLFDHLRINEIRFDADGRIVGGRPTPFDLAGKADGLRDIAAIEGLPMSATAFVGDNHNDLWIARAAGLSIAFNCKSERLRNVCDIEIKKKDLRALSSIIC